MNATSATARRGLLSVLLSALLLLPAAVLPSSAAAADPVPFKTAWLSEHEAFPVWYAKKNGLDRKNGLDVEMVRFETGKAILDGMKEFGWGVAGCGAAASIADPNNEAIEIVAAANDETPANAVLVRADSPILSVQGANPAFPKVYGSADTVRGRTILCPKGTSAHYTLVRWLYVFGFTESDVNVRFLEPRQALQAFRTGEGDVLVLWAPWFYDDVRGDLRGGLKIAARGVDCGANQPVLLVANRELAAERGEDVKAFLRCYFEAVDAVDAIPIPDRVKQYMEFMTEWSGTETDEEIAALELVLHVFYPLPEQKALFDASRGTPKLRRWLKEIADYYGALTPAGSPFHQDPRIPDLDGSFVNALLAERQAAAGK